MNSIQNIAASTCYHCGETCTDHPISFDQKKFCCDGCKTVFQILNENDLCNYYSFDENAGNTVKMGLERKRFEYLMDSDVEHKLVDFKQGSTTSVTFFIPNIHCTSCVWLLESLGKIDTGILKGTVNFLKRTVTIIFDDSKTNLRSVVELLTTIGYEPNLKLEELDETKPNSVNRSLWLKLGVAGFCFGNIMLFSFPEYLKMDQSGSSEMFRYFFGGLNILLAIPVLFYSSTDYLKSAWAALSQRGINLDVPISIGIIALFGRSLYEILSGAGAGYFDSFTGFIFFLLIGKVVQQKTFDHLKFNRDYKSYLPISVLRIKEKNLESILISNLEIGNLILVRNNELIPADSILQTEDALIDYSFITGETEPVPVTKGTLVFAGGKIIGCNAEFIVAQKAEHSYLTQLWENKAFRKSEDGQKLTSFADSISPYFTASVLAIAFISLLIWLTIDAAQAFTIFTAVLIVACPCALALSTPFTLGATVNILSFNGLYVRSTGVIEALSKTTTFVFDKTGTITESQKTEVEFVGKKLDDIAKAQIHCTVKQSLHPLSKIITQHLSSSFFKKTENFTEIEGQGIKSTVDGVKIFIGSRSFLNNNNEHSLPPLLNSSSVGSQVHIMIGGDYKGAFILQNKLRKGITPLLYQLGENHSTYLISGDNEAEAKKLLNAYPYWNGMLFNQSPVQKLEFIDQLHDQNEHVVMIGDGLNDAGALKASDFGIAISDDMSSFSPACDAIAESTSMQNIGKLVDFSKSAFKIILASFGVSLLYNITGLGFAVTGHLSPLVAAIIMPLSSVSVMGFTNVATRIKANQLKLKIWA